MANSEKLQVPCAKGMQLATSEVFDATGRATAHATGGLKALAQRVLDRNQARNRQVTKSESLCNFSGAKENSKVACSEPSPDLPRVADDAVQAEAVYGRVTCLRCSNLTMTGVCRPMSTRDTSYRPLEYVPVMLWRRCDLYRPRFSE